MHVNCDAFSGINAATKEHQQFAATDDDYPNDLRARCHRTWKNVG
jgi:hypothetical protein